MDGHVPQHANLTNPLSVIVLVIILLQLPTCRSCAIICVGLGMAGHLPECGRQKNCPFFMCVEADEDQDVLPQLGGEITELLAAKNIQFKFWKRQMKEERRMLSQDK